MCRYFGDVGENSQEQMVIFSSDFCVDILSKADTIYVDGTFDTCPQDRRPLV